MIRLIAVVAVGGLILGSCGAADSWGDDAATPEVTEPVATEPVVTEPVGTWLIEVGGDRRADPSLYGLLGGTGLGGGVGLR